VIGCFERYGDLIDWAMLILNPFEPWPGELALGAAARHGVRVVTRVVDYGGLFHDDVLPGQRFPDHDHRGFRPDGWVEAGREKLDLVRPLAERHGLTPLQLACVWNLAHEAVECVAPTLIQEPGPDAKPIERKREELAAVPSGPVLSAAEVDEIRRIGNNSGSMLLKGATPDHDGEERPDRWPVAPWQAELARRWGIDPGRDLRRSTAATRA
jgi:aryl-alcohol dehydrogenase-like predicted oxidoreductase